MDRTQIARGLPKHLKIYVLEGPYSVLFGVPAPDVPKDVTRCLKGGTWLAYITAVAKAAGHAVPDRAESLPDRELMTWGGGALADSPTTSDSKPKRCPITQT